MPPRIELTDPRDLFFGLNDLAARVRTLSPNAEREWTAIASYINGNIDYLTSLASGKKQPSEPLTGGMEQGVIVALHALKLARRAAEKRAIDSTAEAVEQASRAIRSAGNISLPSFAVEKFGTQSDV